MRQGQDITTMKEGFGKITRWITAVPRIYHLLAIAVIFILLVIIHYHESFTNISLLDRISSFLEFGLTRQTFGRILFLIPITYGAFVLGLGASISLLVLSLAAMLPRIWILSAAPREAIFETAGVVFTGILIVLLVDVLQKARQRLIDLEALRKMLDLQIERLSMLHTMSNYVSQSLKLDDVLSAVEMIKQLIKAKASWLYLWDEEQKQLHLAAAKGLPEKALPDTLSSGEGPDGKAAVSKEAIIVENASSESDGILAPWGKHDLKSMLVVPLIAKGEFVGTMGVGTRLAHHFSQDEVDLLRAVSDQLSMAVENARLYERGGATTAARRG